jgi:hypothetical protein
MGYVRLCVMEQVFLLKTEDNGCEGQGDGSRLSRPERWIL